MASRVGIALALADQLICACILWSVGRDYTPVPVQRSPKLGQSSSVVFADARKQHTPHPGRLSCTPGHCPPFRESLSFGTLAGKEDPGSATSALSLSLRESFGGAATPLQGPREQEKQGCRLCGRGEKLAARDFLEMRWLPCPQCPFMGCSQRRMVVASASAGRHLSPGTGTFPLPLKGTTSPAAPKTAPCHVPSPDFEWGWRNFTMLGMKEWCGRDVHQPLQRNDIHTPATLSPPWSCSGAWAVARS